MRGAEVGKACHQVPIVDPGQQGYDMRALSFQAHGRVKMELFFIVAVEEAKSESIRAALCFGKQFSGDRHLGFFVAACERHGASEVLQGFF